MVELSVEPTLIPGLLVVRLPVHEDARGWFKENWQRSKMRALGLPDFGPVQNNMSMNFERGSTRGIHAEPWDKFVSVASGRVFGAWVDLREGPSFGATFWTEVGPDTAVFVPRGVGNAYQALVDGTVYSYLVNDHWKPGVTYPALNLADPTAAIPWPIPLDTAEVSEKDKANPALGSVTAMAPKSTVIIGANGQVGRALTAEFPRAVSIDRSILDLSDPDSVNSYDWSGVETVINAAAYTAVDAAETSAGRADAWRANASGPAALARLASTHRFTLVHYSSDYVFDGTEQLHTEVEPFSPLGTYGQSKAAGDLAVATTSRHYILRTSWVIGDGNNFVRTMQRLADSGVSPTVITDQHGRLTFATTLASVTSHLLAANAPFGTYNVSDGGRPHTWHEYASEVFRLTGRNPKDVAPTTTAAYATRQRDAGRPFAPRPAHSTLDLSRLIAVGWKETNSMDELAEYLGS